MSTARKLAITNEILRGMVGSTAHGTNVHGQDDRDEMGVFIEPKEYVLGLEQCDHYIYRTQPEGVRSGPGDLDLTIYSLRKYVRLAVQGNPSILALLYLPEYMEKTELGKELVELRDAFVSQNAGRRFLGYLVSQRQSLTGEKTKAVTRTELVEQYGFDTKFAMHALRLGYQGFEYMMTGHISIPVPEPVLSRLRAVRTGQIAFPEVLAEIADVEKTLTFAIGQCARLPDRKRINEFLIHAHMRHWNAPHSV